MNEQHIKLAHTTGQLANRLKTDTKRNEDSPKKQLARPRRIAKNIIRFILNHQPQIDQFSLDIDQVL